MTIYIVQGSTGEYSDHREWLVKAFTSEDRARGLVISASARAREIQQWYQNDNDGDWYDEDKRPTNEYDPEMVDQGWPSNGWNYTVLPVELVEGDIEP